MKKEICIEAINLRTQRLNGYKLLTVYSKEYGLLKLSGSKLGGRSEPFVHNLFWIGLGGSEVHSIKQSEFQGYFRNIPIDLLRLSHACQYAEFLELCTHSEEEKSKEIFELLLNTLKELNQEEYDSLSLSINFLWKLSDLLGYKPCLNLCHLPSEKCFIKQAHNNDFQAWFDFEQGGVLCQSCPESPSQDSVKILPGIYKLLSSLDQGKEPQAIKNAKEFVMSLLQRYLQKHTDRQVKSVRMIQRLKNQPS